MRRVWMIVAMLMLVIGVAGVGLFKWLGGEGTSELENWVGQCVVGVIESHLTATVEFDQLDYQAPGTVVLDGLKLVGEGSVPLVEVGRLQLTLATVPRLNQPIQIERIELESPSLYFTQGADGGFVGWSSLVKSAVLDEGLAAVPEEFRLSEVLVMRRIDIRDARLEYDAGTGAEPMVLRDLTTSLDTTPEVDEPGWYAIKGSMSRAPQLSVDYDGRVNIDTMLIELARLTASMRLEEAQYETLPPQIQSVVRQYALRGELNATMSASIPATDPAAGSADLKVQLIDAFISFGESVLPIDKVDLTLRLADRTVNLDAKADLLSGSAAAQASTSFDGEMPVRASYQASEIDLQKTLATVSTDTPPRYSGIVRLSGEARSLAATPLESIKGGGNLFIEKGRLVSLPVVSDLANAVSKPFGGKDNANDEVVVEYDFMSDHLAIRKLELKSTVVAARGDGRVFYDQRLALALNAGPMEKLQNQLGKIGDLFGKITDTLVKYYVGGTISKPEVSVKPLGLGAAK